MQKYKSNLTSVSGAAVRGASVTVLDESGATASIFLDRAGTLPAGNPLKTAQDGTFEFYAANGRYSLRTDSSGLNVLEEDVIIMFDPENSVEEGPIADAVAAAQDEVREEITAPSGSIPTGGFDAYEKLRAYAGPATRIQMLGPIAGYFSINPGSTEDDDGGVVIIDALGRRWVREIAPGARVYGEWFEVKGDDQTLDDAPFFRALEFAKSQGSVLCFGEGKKILLSLPIAINKNFCGIAFDGEFNPYSYQNWAEAKQGIRFADGTLGVSDIGIAVDCLAPVLTGFCLSAPFGQGFALQLQSYGGRYKNIRIVGFNGTVATCGNGSLVAEPIFNHFENVDGYSDNYGLVVGRDANLQVRTGAANECTYVNCRFRGKKHAYWVTKTESPITYNQVHINTIFQETSPVGSPAEFFDIIKMEGGFIRGIQFLGGRIETQAEAGRKTPRLDLSGVSETKPLFFTLGTYVHTSVVVNDPYGVWGGIGDVYDSSARFQNVRTNRLQADTIAAKSLNGLLMQASSSTSDEIWRMASSETETSTTVTSRYATAASPVPNNVVAHYMQYRNGNVWRRHGMRAGLISSEHSLVWSIVDADQLRLTTSGLLAVRDNAFSLGNGSNRYSTAYLGSNPVVSSDARLKRVRGSLTAEEMRAWSRVTPLIYQFIDMVAEKGETVARLHAGYIAQDVEAAFAAEGLDVHRYALWCEDPVFETIERKVQVQRQKMESKQTERLEIEVIDGVPIQRVIRESIEVPVVEQLGVVDESGNPVMDDDVQITHPVPIYEVVEVSEPEEVQTGTRLSLRYEQCLIFETAYLRTLLSK